MNNEFNNNVKKLKEFYDENDKNKKEINLEMKNMIYNLEKKKDKVYNWIIFIFSNIVLISNFIFPVSIGNFFVYLFGTILFLNAILYFIKCYDCTVSYYLLCLFIGYFLMFNYKFFELSEYSIFVLIFPLLYFIASMLIIAYKKSEDRDKYLLYSALALFVAVIIVGRFIPTSIIYG